MVEKDWTKIIDGFTSQVDKITKKYVEQPPPTSNSILKINNSDGFLQNIIKNKILSTVSVLIISFIVVSCIFYFSKPKFLISEIKDEKTFLIEKKIKTKMLLGLSLFLSLIIAFVFFKYF
jgi:hypothetical protein